MSMASRQPSDPHPHALRNAWIWVISLPFAFALAMVTGEGLLSMQGYESGGDTAVPIWQVLASGVPALLIVLIPASMAVVAGMRARRDGDEMGLFPAVIAATLGAIFLLTNMAGLFIGR